MTSRAKITFSQPGAQPPVFVVTSLSSPPWEILELHVESNEGRSGDLIFSREFDHVAEGSYQYKIRIGHEHWVVDETQESATDESGNRNNVLHVKASTESSTSSATPTTDKERQDSLQQDSVSSQPGPQVSHIPALEPIETPPSAEVESHTDSAQGQPNQVPSVPVPFTVVEKVPDEPRPEYGDAEADSLHEIDSKRAADAEPDVETVQPSEPAEPEHQEPTPPPIPTLIVEKTDDEPSFGDDFGEHATSAQKIAHDKRRADATPDEVVVSPDSKPVDSPQEDDIDDGGPSPLDEGYSPLFKHESFKQSPVDTNHQVANKGMGTIEEESETSATNTQASSDDLMPADEEDDEDDGGVSELDHAPLFRHESNVSQHDDAGGELHGGPLLPHEAGYSDYSNSNGVDEEVSEDYDEEELEHVNYDEEGDIEGRTFESGRAPSLPHETMNGNDYESEAPLLPHERDSLTPVSSRESGILNNDPIVDGEPTFEYEHATPVSGSGSEDPGVYFSQRTRTKSGSLPHTIPRSDAADENLDDPSLEAFPTSREAIMARMSTISSSLPEDEVEEREQIGSPGFTILSQAASSVSLAPGSGSLPSVEEDGELDDVHDTGSHKDLPSPVLDMAPASKGQQDTPSTPALNITPADGSKGETAGAQAPEASTAPSATTDLEQPATRSIAPSESSTTESVQKHDGTKDSSKKLAALQDAVATPLNTLQPPDTPSNKLTTPTDEATPTKPSQDTNTASSDASIAKGPTKDDAGPKQNWFSWLLNSCFGDSGKKRASEAVFVAVVAAAAYFWLYR